MSNPIASNLVAICARPSSVPAIVVMFVGVSWIDDNPGRSGTLRLLRWGSCTLTGFVYIRCSERSLILLYGVHGATAWVRTTINAPRPVAHYPSRLCSIHVGHFKLQALRDVTQPGLAFHEAFCPPLDEGLGYQYTMTSDQRDQTFLTDNG